MTSERWRKIDELFHAARERQAGERARFLQEATGDDEELRREVESLLSYDDQAEDFLEATALTETVRALAGNEASLEAQRKVLTLLFQSELGGEDAGAELRVTTPQGRTRSIPLESSEITLGRAKDNDLSFPEDDGLSRQHLKFERAETDWMVRDLGSKNGTFVNGARISDPVRLQPGDRISASCITITYTASR